MSDRKQIRMNPEERKQQLLRKGFEMAARDGLSSVNRVRLGKACGVTDGLVSRYFGNAHGMYSAIIDVAAREKQIGVIADALQMGYCLDRTVSSAMLKRAKTEVRRRVREEIEAQTAAFA